MRVLTLINAQESLFASRQALPEMYGNRFFLQICLFHTRPEPPVLQNAITQKSGRKYRISAILCTRYEPPGPAGECAVSPPVVCSEGGQLTAKGDSPFNIHTRGIASPTHAPSVAKAQAQGPSKGGPLPKLYDPQRRCMFASHTSVLTHQSSRQSSPITSRSRVTCRSDLSGPELIMFGTK